MAGVKGRSGRKSMEIEQEMLQRLSVMTDDAYNILHKAIKEEKSWAVKMFFDRTYGKAKEQKELEITTAEVPLFNILLDSNDDLI